MKNKQTGMTLIVKMITRLTVGLILIYGIYIVLQGHISPGGGFAGGVIITLSFVHLMLAFGRRTVLKKITKTKSLKVASVAALIFLALLYFGFTSGGHASGSRPESFKLSAAGFIPLYDIITAALSGAALFVAFLALALLTGEREKER